ncbi:MAG: hypothetical protein G01um101448_481 [Parcubacteria group bacterium Gr01-1014_48]|nr:MAG: hypothetical protein Greene041614_691 [Parcubacteria group bacterium Greene0416_14]TSC73872.1 MAG: hypothetical protein G01um101448_481 [Parcubacteria group bacterium Gr01-1014_48]TSD01569.1 MAG: hypothetical protein Greene101415_149 [Parcubacteria group bacterium Greene1014_15]TSD08131.1 MAG: hypothetical protein Greene07144_366 [Parcubacteria group bacterium Greene0714_4]
MFKSAFNYGQYIILINSVKDFKKEPLAEVFFEICSLFYSASDVFIFVRVFTPTIPVPFVRLRDVKISLAYFS